MARRLPARSGAPGADDGAEAGIAPAPLAIAGTEGLLVTYARCCFPIPGDPIFAFLSTGRGIVIHRENCVNVEDYRKHPEKWLPVNWQASAGPAVQLRDPGLRRQPHGHAGCGRGGHREHSRPTSTACNRRARTAKLSMLTIRAAGA